MSAADLKILDTAVELGARLGGLAAAVVRRMSVHRPADGAARGHNKGTSVS